ncbi:hypothetical protein [Clostridium sp.]
MLMKSLKMFFDSKNVHNLGKV